ncbi:PhzF family phenazine biosynthesis isomerase [Clostridium sp. KNHs205]|jgi:PhzF family phenazine biosynthesis protein|uniref:PhzF family phenazine biosynthesis protein n=1 Tax=Clostridium sp. KNHs205 TaxID=1449050 RepID=UPI00051C61E0|nr:PhzF family phenazine biosynthesis isomerase [Clostridium sp. KNHs205]
MKSVKVYHYDAFSTTPGKGNPAGVVLSGDELSEKEMQQIALQVGFNETAFVVQSARADLKIRFFTPGHEMNLCGHATMATIYALKTQGILGNQKDLAIETRAGILPVKITDTANGITITMKQAKPEFLPFEGSREALAASLGLTVDDLAADLPVLYGSTGTWTLLVPIKKLEAFLKMKPQNNIFPAVLTEKPKTSVHPFCFETYDTEADMHARHFSSPYSGTVEDPVTGTASGVMGAFYATYIKKDFDKTLTLTIEQGQEVGKDGRVIVRVTKVPADYEVEILGTAVYVKEFELQVES